MNSCTSVSWVINTFSPAPSIFYFELKYFKAHRRSHYEGFLNSRSAVISTHLFILLIPRSGPMKTLLGRNGGRDAGFRFVLGSLFVRRRPLGRIWLWISWSDLSCDAPQEGGTRLTSHHGGRTGAHGALPLLEDCCGANSGWGKGETFSVVV